MEVPGIGWSAESGGQFSQAIALLKQAGLKVVDWFGVRIYSDDDNRPFEQVPAFHRNRILSDEIKASSNPKLKSAGQILHFIAQKV